MKHKSIDEKYDLCDRCERPGTVIACPSAVEEIEHGLILSKEFCEDCCEDEFRFNPQACIFDASECSRAQEIQKMILKEISEENNFQPWKFEESYISSNNTIAIGITPLQNSLNNGVLVPIDLYRGDEYYLAENNGKKMLIGERIFKKL